MFMDNPIKPVLFVLYSLAFLSPVFAADLKTYKEVYQKNSAEILQLSQPKFTDLQQQYQKSLDTLKTLSKKQGDLKKTMAAIAEIERFQKAKSLPATPDESAIQEVKALQSAYVKRYSELETDLTAKLGTLTAKYDQALERLQKELVQAEKLADAMEVQQEREKAQSTLKGYAEQMSALSGSSATNVNNVAASNAPATVPDEKSTLIEGSSVSVTGAHTSIPTLGKNVVINGDFSQVVRRVPAGWGGKLALLTVETEGNNKFVRFTENKVNKEGVVKSLHCTSQEIPIPKGAESVTVSAKIRTKDCVNLSTIAPGVQIELTNQENIIFRYIAKSWGGKNGDWETIQGKDKVPKEAVKAVVVISTGYRPGQIDFDDVEVIFE
jgi:hypothetical protein